MVFNKFCDIFKNCSRKIYSQKNLSSQWKSTIGLEIHAQLPTKTKLFSCAPSVYGIPTNSAVSLFDAAIPGTLPVINKEAVELAVLSSLALGCKINPVSYFDRKHYFYSDLPALTKITGLPHDPKSTAKNHCLKLYSKMKMKAGYQITQQRFPVAENGEVNYAIYQPGIHDKPYYKKSRIKQVQLEQDSGKSLHDFTQKRSFIDLNRAGIALVEIVFQPDVEDEYEACALIKEVIDILQNVQSYPCKMEEGALRVDVNLSMSKSENNIGVRTEIKNIGSVSGVSKAIKYEINRQVKILNSGGFIKNETFAWDAELDRAVSMRKKEEKEDYRFMPEPNLPPLRLLIDEHSENFHKNTKSNIFILNLRHLREKIPKLPQDERISLIQNYAFDDVDAFNLVNQNKLLSYFKKIMGENSKRNPRTVYLFLMYQLLNHLELNNLKLSECWLCSTQLGEIVDLLQERRISKPTSEYILNQFLSKKITASPIEWITEKNLFIMSQPEELRALCKKIVEEEASIVSSYKYKNKKKLFNQLVYKAIEESGYRADTKMLPKIMSEILSETGPRN